MSAAVLVCVECPSYEDRAAFLHQLSGGEILPLCLPHVTAWRLTNNSKEHPAPYGPEACAAWDAVSIFAVTT